MPLITDNPARFGGLDGYGLQIVARVEMPVMVTPHDVRYLRTDGTGWAIAWMVWDDRSERAGRQRATHRALSRQSGGWMRFLVTPAKHDPSGTCGDG